jgi:hypothetical protein
MGFLASPVLLSTAGCHCARRLFAVGKTGRGVPARYWYIESSPTATTHVLPDFGCALDDGGVVSSSSSQPQQ